MTKAKVNGKCRLAIDFPDAASLLEFVDWLRAADPRYAEADAFAMDVLDEQNQSSEITRSNTFMLRGGQWRIPGTSLRELTGQPRATDMNPGLAAWLQRHRTIRDNDGLAEDRVRALRQLPGGA